VEESGRGLIIRYYPDICLEGLRKTTRNSQDSPSPRQDLNPGGLEYKAGVLITRPRSSISWLVIRTCIYLIKFDVLFVLTPGTSRVCTMLLVSQLVPLLSLQSLLNSILLS
jgi:hypothetical protein